VNSFSPFSQRQLCDYFEMDYREVAAIAKYLGMTTHDYLQAKTSWRLYQEQYYPPHMDFNQILAYCQGQKRINIDRASNPK
jgi:hypothetical protein